MVFGHEREKSAMSWWIPGEKQNGKQFYFLVGGILSGILMVILLLACLLSPLLSWLRHTFR